MPARSQAQGSFFRVVRAMQRGDIPMTDTPAGRAAKSITPRDAHEFAVTPNKGLPEEADKGAEKKAQAHLNALKFVFCIPALVKFADVQTSIRAAEKAVRSVSEQRRKHYATQAQQLQKQNETLQKQVQQGQMNLQKAQMQMQQSTQQIDSAQQAQQALHAAPASQPPFGAMIPAIQAQQAQGGAQ